MKAVICVLFACVLAVAYAQLPTGTTGGSSSSGMASLFSSRGGAGGGMGSMFSSRGGMPNQMLYMAALNGNENARMMLQCSMMNLPLFLCMRTLA